MCFLEDSVFDPDYYDKGRWCQGRLVEKNQVRLSFEQSAFSTVLLRPASNSIDLVDLCCCAGDRDGRSLVRTERVMISALAYVQEICRVGQRQR